MTIPAAFAASVNFAASRNAIASATLSTTFEN
jgi:hypothetical protein